MAIRFSMVISVGVSVCRIVSSTDARCCLSSCSIIASSTEPAEDTAGVSGASREDTASNTVDGSSARSVFYSLLSALTIGLVHLLS